VEIGPLDSEIALLNLKKERKKLTQVKYIARSAGLPSGLMIALLRKLFITEN